MTPSENSHIIDGIKAQQSGVWKQALRHYAAAIESEPNEAFAYQLRGALNLELKRFYDALRDFDQAILLAPYNEVGYWGKAHVFMGLKDYRWAVIQFTNAIDLLPEDGEQVGAYYLDRAEAYERLGESERANQDRQRHDRLLHQ